MIQLAALARAMETKAGFHRASGISVAECQSEQLGEQLVADAQDISASIGVDSMPDIDTYAQMLFVIFLLAVRNGWTSAQLEVAALRRTNERFAFPAVASGEPKTVDPARQRLCLKCGFTWTKKKGPEPKRCPNHECRAKTWNKHPVATAETPGQQVIAQVRAQVRAELRLDYSEGQ